jgi:diguanylate cyclase (GGDEF)-like protein
MEEAKKIALTLRERVRQMQIEHVDSRAAPIVTVSQGLYVMRGGTESTAEGLYELADRALYQAKARGRDCIVMYDSAVGESELVPIVPAHEAGRRLLV